MAKKLADISTSNIMIKSHNKDVINGSSGGFSSAINN